VIYAQELIAQGVIGAVIYSTHRLSALAVQLDSPARAWRRAAEQWFYP